MICDFLADKINFLVASYRQITDQKYFFCADEMIFDMPDIQDFVSSQKKQK
jgi:hypothetical protein